MESRFSRETVMRAWLRCEGKCECQRPLHGHAGRCNRLLAWSQRGREGNEAWEIRPRNSNSEPTLSNCKIVCRTCIRRDIDRSKHTVRTGISWF